MVGPLITIKGHHGEHHWAFQMPHNFDISGKRQRQRRRTEDASTLTSYGLAFWTSKLHNALMGEVTRLFTSCPLGEPESFSRWALFSALHYSIADILCLRILRSSSPPPFLFRSTAPRRRLMVVRYPQDVSTSGHIPSRHPNVIR